MRLDRVEDQADDQDHTGDGGDTEAQRIDGEHGTVRLPADGAERGRDEGEDIEQNLPSPFVDSDKVTKIDSFCSEIMVILYQF